MSIPEGLKAKDDYFKKGQRQWKIDKKRYVALKHGSAADWEKEFKIFIEEKKMKSSYFQTNILEPVRIDFDLTTWNPFGKNKSLPDDKAKIIEQEIEVLRKKHKRLVESVVNKSLRRLTIYSNKKDKYKLRNTLYSLWRLSIAQRVQDNLKKIKPPIADILALYYAEGYLCIPLSLEAIFYRLKSDPFAFLPYGQIARIHHNFPQNTFYVEKKTNWNTFLQTYPEHKSAKTLTKLFQKQTQSAIIDREFMKENIDKENFEGSDPVNILNAGKENANQYFMSILAGLDFYMWGIIPSITRHHVGHDFAGFLVSHWNIIQYRYQRRDLFSYQYARYRIKAGFIDSFYEMRDEGKNLYEQMCSVDKKSFKEGKVWSNSIVCTTYHKEIRSKRKAESKELIYHHFIPLSPVDFVSPLLTAGMVRFEAYRRASLICGGMRFDSKKEQGNGNYAPLPHALAYIRYNMWDINFVLIILTALYRIIHGKDIEEGITKQYLWRLKEGLGEFDKKNDVWTVFNNWDKGDKFFEKKVSRLDYRKAIWNDARTTQIYSNEKPGTSEKNFIKRLNADGKLNTVIPLIDAIIQKELWEDLEKAVFSNPVMRLNMHGRNDEIKSIKIHYRSYHERFIGIFEDQ